MKSSLVTLLLLVGTITLGSQSVLVPAGLLPYRFNTVFVTGIPANAGTRVSIVGRTLQGNEVPLFLSQETMDQGQIRCVFYLDDSIYSLEVDIAATGSKPRHLEFPGQQNPYRVAVLGSRAVPALSVSGYIPASNLDQLRPGDIYLLQERASPETRRNTISGLLASGIHVIMGESQGPQEELFSKVERSLEQGPWSARLLAIDSFDPHSLRSFLEERRELFLSFKKRYHALIAEASFYGLPVQESGELSFANAKPEDIAATLESRLFQDRLSLFHQVLLIAFYLPALTLLLLVKKTKTLLVPVSLLLAAFMLVSVLVPGRDRMLRLDLNPFQTTGETVELEQIPTASGSRAKLLSTVPEEYRFVARSYSTETWTLSYTMIRSVEREVSLERFHPVLAVKFNQIPRIRLDRGEYIIEYENPLRAWSLHELK